MKIPYEFANQEAVICDESWEAMPGDLSMSRVTRTWLGEVIILETWGGSFVE